MQKKQIEKRRQIEQESDYIIEKKYKNSLKTMMLYNSCGVSNVIICKVLGITPKELIQVHKEIVNKLKLFLQNKS